MKTSKKEFVTCQKLQQNPYKFLNYLEIHEIFEIRHYEYFLYNQIYELVLFEIITNHLEMFQMITIF